MARGGVEACGLGKVADCYNEKHSGTDWGSTWESVTEL